MAFYFIDWIHTNDGYHPCLPEGTGFLLLAEPAGEPKYALFSIGSIDSDNVPDGVEAVSFDLAKLLNSAIDYPPAMAIARAEVRRIHYASRAEFAADLAARLSVHLAAQKNSPIFLAKVVGSKTVYATPGRYYWIVNYRPNRKGHELSWVSDDYFVYSDPIDDFDVDPVELAARFPPTYRLSPDQPT